LNPLYLDWSVVKCVNGESLVKGNRVFSHVIGGNRPAWVPVQIEEGLTLEWSRVSGPPNVEGTYVNGFCLDDPKSITYGTRSRTSFDVTLLSRAEHLRLACDVLWRDSNARLPLDLT